MKKILSIDLSFVMSPSIDEYEDWVRHSTWPSKKIQWEMFVKKMGYEPESCPKREKYLVEVLKGVLPSLSSPEHLVFSSNHSDIVERISGHKDLIIHNIDQCHDIYYEEWSSPTHLDSHNWVWWLDKNEQIESYSWFGNKNSREYEGHMDLGCSFFKTHERRDSAQPMDDPDFVFVCESPEWVPSDSRHTYRTMRSLANSYFKAG